MPENCATFNCSMSEMHVQSEASTSDWVHRRKTRDTYAAETYGRLGTINELREPDQPLRTREGHRLSTFKRSTRNADRVSDPLTQSLSSNVRDEASRECYTFESPIPKLSVTQEQNETTS